MKKITKKLAALLLVLALLCGALAITANAGPANLAGKKFVVLGDSVAAGIGATAEENGYAWIVAKELGLTLANHAVPGDTTAGLLKILAEDKAAQQAIRQADIINVSIGGNDLLAANVMRLLTRLLILHDESTLNPVIEEYRKNFAQVVEKIRTLNSSAMLVIQTPYNSMERVLLIEQGYELVSLRMCKVYDDYLAEHPSAFVIADLHSAFKGREGLISRDLLHPSDAGHAMIARVVSATIQGKTLQLETPPAYNPTLWQKITFFVRTIIDYFKHWLSFMSVWELIRNAVSFF